MKTSELTGTALDWAVAKCEDVVIIEDYSLASFPLLIVPGEEHLVNDFYNGYSPSTDWAKAGPIIEREQIEVRVHEGSRVKCEWKSGHWDEDKGVCVWSVGPTPLIAAMRCYVASKLGDEVEIPKELT